MDGQEPPLAPRYKGSCQALPSLLMGRHQPHRLPPSHSNLSILLCCLPILLLTLPTMLSALSSITHAHFLWSFKTVAIFPVFQGGEEIRQDRIWLNMPICSYQKWGKGVQGEALGWWRSPQAGFWGCQIGCSSGGPRSPTGDTAVGSSTWSCYFSCTDRDKKAPYRF